MQSSTGKVFLIGAGPGDPGLITLKAQHILSIADVVIYDSLVNELLLEQVNQKAEIIFAGKRHNYVVVSQEGINKILVEKALEGKVIARLKGGDPLIFARIGEELSALVDDNIPFEIVPGVSSITAIPAYTGIPLTHRHYSSSVIVLTGHEISSETKNGISWEAVAQVETIVILMGVAFLEKVVRHLSEAGRSLETPIVLTQWGTYPQQRSVRGTLATIVDQVAEAQLEAPALIVIGEVCRFTESFNWFEQQPLFGKRIVVTRAPHQQSSLATSLTSLGAEVLRCPTIEIQEPESWEAFDQIALQPEAIDWVVFTSQNSIRKTMERLEALGKDVRIFGNMKIACIGEATARCLKEYALIPDLIPSEFQSEGLLEAMQAYGFWQGQQLWFPQAVETRNHLETELESLGAQVHRSPVYQNQLPTTDPQPLLEQLEAQQIDWITFTSASTVHHFFQLFPLEKHDIVRQHPPRWACIGKITANALTEYGFQADVVPKTQTLEGLVEAIKMSH